MHSRKVPWYSVFSFFIFLLRSNGKNEHLDENHFRHAYGNYFKSAVLKVTWFQLCSKLSTITRHIDNGISNILYCWRFYGHGSTYMLIFSWVNIMKWKWEKVPWELSVSSLPFEEYCTRTFHLLLYCSSALKQTQFLNST